MQAQATADFSVAYSLCRIDDNNLGPVRAIQVRAGRPLLRGHRRGAATKLGLPPSTLDSRIKAVQIDKRRFQAN